MQTHLEGAIVGYVACDHVDVLEVRCEGLQMARTRRVSDDGENRSVGSAGLTNDAPSVASLSLQDDQAYQLADVLEADATGGSYNGV